MSPLPGTLSSFVAESSRALAGGRFWCSLCGKVVRQIRQHVRDLHWAGSPKHACPACRRTYTTRRAFKLHCDTVHRDWAAGGVSLGAVQVDQGVVEVAPPPPDDDGALLVVKTEYLNPDL